MAVGALNDCHLYDQNGSELETVLAPFFLSVGLHSSES